MRTNAKERSIVFPILLGLVVLLISVNFFLNDNISNDFVWLGSQRKASSQDMVKLKEVSNKWIVVTSINHPTEDVKRLAETGWNLVVVADKKTPSDWYLKGVHFLSIEKQVQLELKLPRRLPFGTYTRKNVGYLYAIMNGAEWIYDTDDDNKPYGLGLDQFDYEDTISGVRYEGVSVWHGWTTELKRRIFNPYTYFGNSKMWPRGFPLEMLSNHTNELDQMIVCREMKTAAVQQGLVHQDPDVDAIYRLLNADAKTGLNVSFDRFAPPITLERGVYSPWNSQNTLFNKKAFFTMLLPTSVAFRVTDIWRSYFAQKLLHLVNETVAFYPVNTIQIRNAHNYLADFEDEKDVYLKSGAIIKTIEDWRCLENTTEKCVVSLAKRFSRLGYWNDTEVQLVRDWVDDLKATGYDFPELADPYIHTKYQANPDRNSNCIRVHMDFSRNSQVKTDKQRHQNIEDMLGFCNDKANTSLNMPFSRKGEYNKTNHKGISQKNTTALILASNRVWSIGMGALQRLYEPYFAVTIFCGTWNQTNYEESNEPFARPRPPVNYIDLSSGQLWGSTAAYYCLSKARDLKMPNIEGYYVLSDDTVYNFWQNIDQDRVSLLPGWTKDTAKWDSDYGKNKTCTLVESIVSGKYANNSRVQSVWNKYDELSWRMMNQSGIDTMSNFTESVLTDMYYIPTSHLDFAADMFELLNDLAVNADTAVSKVFHLFDVEGYPNQTEYLPWINSHLLEQVYNSSLIMLHSLELGTALENEPALKRYCNSFIKTFIQSIL